MFERLDFEQAVPVTRKLFHKDNFMSAGRATVLFVRDEYVVLDQTIFYAESGGQVPDQGRIAGIEVVDVQNQGGIQIKVKHPKVKVPAVKVNTVIVHRLAEKAPFQIGDEVKLSLDWEHRYEVMRQHSASHFLFHAANELLFKGEVPPVKGCRIDAGGHRFDFAADIEPDLISEVEVLANALIAEGREIVLEPEPRSPDIRYWCYGDDIIIPCGGTHVRSAAELAPLTFKRRTKGKGLTRLSGAFQIQG